MASPPPTPPRVQSPLRLRVLVVEPYFSGSHRAWAEGLAAHSVHDVRLVTHHGGFWKWRMQGAALTLADDIDRLVTTWGRPDVALVSDMVHVPALLGLARRSLSGVPVVAYFHENQLTYPVPEGEPVDHTYAMTNWLSMAAADHVVFNSEYHRRDVFTALPSLLRRLPDHRHTGFVDRVRARTSVLPVGVDADRFQTRGPRTGRDDQPPVVLWNHRWEYDKDPATFVAALDAVAAAGVAFRLIVAGESYQTVPPELERARQRFRDRIVAFGTASHDDYPVLLGQADVVVSTALHEFFGVAVVEAVTAGAFPLLPHRLSYPELVPEPHDTYLYGDADDLVDRLGWALTDHAGRRAAASVATEHVERFDWRHVAPRYDELLARAAAAAASSPA
jgi:glycosyltransferase involved in cell wall biosynthesis